MDGKVITGVELRYILQEYKKHQAENRRKAVKKEETEKRRE